MISNPHVVLVFDPGFHHTIAVQGMPMFSPMGDEWAQQLRSVSLLTALHHLHLHDIPINFPSSHSCMIPCLMQVLRTLQKLQSLQLQCTHAVHGRKVVVHLQPLLSSLLHITSLRRAAVTMQSLEAQSVQLCAVGLASFMSTAAATDLASTLSQLTMVHSLEHLVLPPFCVPYSVSTPEAAAPFSQLCTALAGLSCLQQLHLEVGCSDQHGEMLCAVAAASHISHVVLGIHIDGGSDGGAGRQAPPWSAAFTGGLLGLSCVQCLELQVLSTRHSPVAGIVPSNFLLGERGLLFGVLLLTWWRCAGPLATVSCLANLNALELQGNFRPHEPPSLSRLAPGLSAHEHMTRLHVTNAWGTDKRRLPCSSKLVAALSCLRHLVLSEWMLDRAGVCAQICHLLRHNDAQRWTSACCNLQVSRISLPKKRCSDAAISSVMLSSSLCLSKFKLELSVATGAVAHVAVL